MKHVLMTCLSLLMGGSVALGALDDGLIASYPFNGDAADESGNVYDGTVVGATPITNRFGEADSAYYFDGMNDRINLPNAVLNIERTDSFSQSFWLKTSDAGTGNIIIAKMLSTISYRGIAVSLSDGVLKTSLINDGTAINRMRVDGTTILSDNQWHHVVVTYDGSSLASGIQYYIDGSPETAVIIADTLTGTILNSAMPTIGSRTVDNYYNGALDDLRIYDRALAINEIEQLYKGVMPFAKFSPATTHVDFRDENSTDHFFFSGSFVLNKQSDGIDLVEEDMVLRAGPIVLEIPSGSFKRSGPQYKWIGDIDGARVKASIIQYKDGFYSFSIQAHGIDLTGWSNPEEWELTIGNDNGMTTEWLKGHLQSDKN